MTHWRSRACDFVVIQIERYYFHDGVINALYAACGKIEELLSVLCTAGAILREAIFVMGRFILIAPLRAEACQWLFSITLYLHQSVIILWAFRKQRMLKVCPFQRLRTHSPAPSHVYLTYKKGRHGPPFRIGLFDCLQSVRRAGIEVRSVTGRLHSYPASQPAVLLDICQ